MGPVFQYIRQVGERCAWQGSTEQCLYSFRRHASIFIKQRVTKSKRITGYPIKVVDDIFLYKRIRNQQDAQVLQQDLTNLQEWEKTWEVSFNPTKCEVICITQQRAPGSNTYLILVWNRQYISGLYCFVPILSNLVYVFIQ